MDMEIVDWVREAEEPAPVQGLAEALLRPMGVPGVHARTEQYERVVERLADLITEYRDAEAEVLRFPPVMSRHDLQKSGYLNSFPNLLGCVCALHGSEAEIRSAAQSAQAGREWTTALSPSDLVLSPAACYPVYPLAAERGAMPADGWLFDVACDCFRREPSERVDRLQSFRMREYVRIARPDQVQEFRAQWIEQGRMLAEGLMLPAHVALANDPFFGREGKIKAVSQVQQALKFELLVQVYPDGPPTACMSFNYHLDHFGSIWGIRDAAGSTAHTGCAAFGMDRLAVAMFATHGLDARAWPARARRALRL